MGTPKTWATKKKGGAPQLGKPYAKTPSTPKTNPEAKKPHKKRSQKKSGREGAPHKKKHPSRKRR